MDQLRFILSGPITFRAVDHLWFHVSGCLKLDSGPITFRAVDHLRFVSVDHLRFVPVDHLRFVPVDHQLHHIGLYRTNPK